jgi:hypothetical protein
VAEHLSLHRLDELSPWSPLQQLELELELLHLMAAHPSLRRLDESLSLIPFQQLVRALLVVEVERLVVEAERPAPQQVG